VPHIYVSGIVLGTRKYYHCIFFCVLKTLDKLVLLHNPTVQLGYLEVTVQEKLRSSWPGPFVKVEGCCD
jgi:hypothetical protein